MNGYIYVREQESYNIHNVYKMGKTSNIVERDGTYATGEFNRGSFERVIEVRNDEMSTIEIYLQDRLKHIGLHRQRDGGTEFFDKKMIEYMTPFMEDIGLYFKEISKEEIDQMIRKYRENEINHKKEYIIPNNDRTLDRKSVV